MPASDIPVEPVGEELFCPGCGYDLRGLASERCPECGLTIDREAVAASAIPWMHRTRLGRVNAFRRTVWMAIRHPATLARDAARPVSYLDAQKFRWVVVLLGALPLAAAALLGRWALGGSIPMADGVFASAAGTPNAQLPF